MKLHEDITAVEIKFNVQNDTFDSVQKKAGSMKHYDKVKVLFEYPLWISIVAMFIGDVCTK